MRLTLLGTGNAAGVPLYGCDCDYCLAARQDPAMRRTPCSAILEVGEQKFLVDAGQTNLADQFPCGSLNGIFLTHFHPDHVQGLFHLRWGIGRKIAVYAPRDPQGCADLYQHPGILEFSPVSDYEHFKLANLSILPITLKHSKPTLGYVLEHAAVRIAYLTDTKGLPDLSQKILKQQQLDLMVIDCSFPPGCHKPGHNNLDEVIQISGSVEPRHTLLTHIGHDLDIWLKEHAHKLPAGISVGYDGMLAYPY
jgi:phosphoribosyl 1,2-cyclic phosphate phosphodiesterase